MFESFLILTKHHRGPCLFPEQGVASIMQGIELFRSLGSPFGVQVRGWRCSPWRNSKEGRRALSGWACFIATRTKSLMVPLDSSE